jgi:Na+:H+ antiporter, NhaA family
VQRSLRVPALRFLHIEAASGILLVAAALLALLWANSPWAESYERLWETPVTVGLSRWTAGLPLESVVNDLGMTLFFLVVGLEIKRELVHGHLRDPRTALLPVAGAIGGMVVPVLLYLLVIGDGPGIRGWAIPMATDIAFALAVLSLLSRRVPMGLKTFLLTLAIVDDLVAIIVIALVYSSTISYGWLACAAACVGGIAGGLRLGIRVAAPYVLLAGALWVSVFNSGVHATIAGVLIALLVPAGRLADGGSPLTRLEMRLHPWSAYVVLPLFALANAGIPLHLVGGASRLTWAVGLGLAVGKPAGVLIGSWMAVAWGDAHLPRGCGWRELTGGACLAGIGFTVAIFVTRLAFSEPALVASARMAVLGASAISAVTGAALLGSRPRGSVPPSHTPVRYLTESASAAGEARNG